MFNRRSMLAKLGKLIGGGAAAVAMGEILTQDAKADGSNCYTQYSYTTRTRCTSYQYIRTCCQSYPAHCHNWVYVGIVNHNNCSAYGMCQCCCTPNTSGGCYDNPYSC